VLYRSQARDVRQECVHDDSTNIRPTPVDCGFGDTGVRCDPLDRSEDTLYPTSAVYSATKFAVIAISEGLRQENNNIRVTVVSPGVTESELANSISDAGTREAMQEFRRIPLPAEAVSSSIAFALSSLTMLT